jgi:hypothetical protein
MEESGARRSRAYHQFFQGYTEVLEEKKNGKTAIKRVYTEDFYQQSGTKAQWIARKCAFTMVYLTSLIAFVLGAWKDCAVNYFAGTIVLEGAGVLFLARSGILVWNYLTAPRKLELGRYREISERLQRRCLIAGAVQMILFLVSLLYAMTMQQAELPELLSSCFAFLLSGSLQLMLTIWGRQISYETIQNPLKGQVIGFRIY